ncbi:uncharacterized protein MYCFIDRAFT_87304 [Pseudocercospora fijiensis CIRAD86]|uniref:Prenylcysteine lyase domain-containing protein n=1 Tax=Pseudocercospora fijiensis (strain CIRAD86) TaxID=383855 RepID=M3ALY2_PSEFD|nr:uncharacterized protein MYCFIDRAFT_87304 [Pseudocercospora fijiensis CIRAD86]EME78153.1 hypothetical protein MYCFIDRAFT_87304 [Pseudocercospora fijiensis CIRAD86]
MRYTNVFATALLLLPNLISAQQTDQIVLQGSNANHGGAADVKPINIAIIGAGAAGSSAAYHLHQYGITSRVPLNLTVFERNDYIGGRSTTVGAYDDPALPVELGASIFVEINHILADAITKFNLSTTDFNDNPKGTPGNELGIWDGERFVLEINGGWWDTAKLIWKYGMAPIKTQRLMKSVVGKFLRMYNAQEDVEEPGVFPFKSLTQAAQDVGLLAVTAATGEQFIRENGITGNFGKHVVQASTRVNYAQNLKYIHGLEAMVCMATEGAVAVEGGNWRIFDKMLHASGAAVHLETGVKEVQKTEEGGYTLSLESVEDSMTIEEDFDIVILAGPYQYSNMTLPASADIPDTIPYVSLHVTLFASPHLLSPTFFNLASDQNPPQVILTTLADSETPGKGNMTVGSPGFLSISLLRPIISPNTGVDEYLYKIFSSEPVSAPWLAKLLGVDHLPDNQGDEISKRDVTWMYRKVWNSYPYEYPRVTFEELKLDDGIWYTGGMDSFISTMETNALMGKNVARLIVDELVEKMGRVKDEGDGEWVLLDENDRDEKLIDVLFHDMDRAFEQAKLFIQREHLEKSQCFIPQLAAMSPANHVIKLARAMSSKVLQHYFHFLVTGRTVNGNGRTLSLAYLFGDEIKDADFTAVMACALQAQLKSEKVAIHSPAVTAIYSAREKGSAARRMVVDFFYCHGRPHWFNEREWKGYPKEFLQDLVVKMMAKNESEEEYGRQREEGQKEWGPGKKRKADMLDTNDLRSR